MGDIYSSYSVKRNVSTPSTGVGCALESSVLGMSQPVFFSEPLTPTDELPTPVNRRGCDIVDEKKLESVKRDPDLNHHNKAWITSQLF